MKIEVIKFDPKVTPVQEDKNGVTQSYIKGYRRDRIKKAYIVNILKDDKIVDLIEFRGYQEKSKFYGCLWFKKGYGEGKERGWPVGRAKGGTMQKVLIECFKDIGIEFSHGFNSESVFFAHDVDSIMIRLTPVLMEKLNIEKFLLNRIHP